VDGSTPVSHSELRIASSYMADQGEERNCVTAPPDVNGNPNLKFVNYSRRKKLNGNKCLKQEGHGGFEAQRRLSLWLSASEDERTGCLWTYTNDDCTEGEQSMSYKLKGMSMI